MKTLGLLFSALVLLFTAGCAGGIGGLAGDGVSNGGGLGEKNLVYAHFTLAGDLKNCFTAMSCALEPEDEKVVRAIHAALVNGVEHVTNVVFISPKDKPDFFVMDGKPKSARTGTKPGSPIFVNIDHLYLNDGFNRPITVRQGTALLIHELGHHQGIGNTDDELARLNRISNTVVKYLEDSESAKALQARSNAMVGQSLVMQCNTISLHGRPGSVNVYFERNNGEVRYTTIWGLGGATRISFDTPRTEVRIKSGEGQVQLLQALDSKEELDFRISTTPGVGALGGTATVVGISDSRYKAAMYTNNRPTDTWTCTVKPEASRVFDPMSLLFLR